MGSCQGALLFFAARKDFGMGSLRLTNPPPFSLPLGHSLVIDKALFPDLEDMPNSDLLTNKKFERVPGVKEESLRLSHYKLELPEFLAKSKAFRQAWQL